CLQSRSHGLGEAFMSHVHERLTLCVTPVDGVEHEPHRPGFFGDGREVRLNCITIQRVYSCHLDLAPVGMDFRSNCLELSCGPTGKEYVCSFPGESLGDGTSNGSTSSIYNCGLVFEQHVSSFFRCSLGKRISPTMIIQN